MNIDVDVCNVPQYGVCAYECVTWVDYLFKILQLDGFTTGMYFQNSISLVE